MTIFLSHKGSEFYMSMDAAVDGVIIGTGLNATLDGDPLVGSYFSGAIRGSVLRLAGYPEAASFG